MEINLTEEAPIADQVTGPGAGIHFKPDTDTREELRRLRADLEKYKGIALRSAADFDNYRKRMIREKDEAIRYANVKFLEQLIPILDSFELGLAAAKAGGQPTVMNGMGIVFKQLQDFIASCGVETIEAAGECFNPSFHEAVAQQASAKVKDGFVIQQLRKGYRLMDRIIRAASVVVSKGRG